MRKEKKQKKMTDSSIENLVFALDIGTRSIVGILGTVTNDSFAVFDFEQRFHQNRAMRDGQIEDINLVARTAQEVKDALEERNGIIIRKVSIAAAGRSLKTVRRSFEQELIEDDDITAEVMRSAEYSAISAALDEFTEAEPELGQDAGGKHTFSCVGYDVVSYHLDNYPLANPLGHRGKSLKVDVIAAFLPFSVVRSLYSVTEKCGLAVDSLTLEPIAAINAVVPQDIRLLNIAITDIGAGTSDIGISKNGSIVAYDMVTTAGDEITETIMRQYLVDFNTAESIKFKLAEEGDITFTDILGLPRSIAAKAAMEAVDPSVNKLADAIAETLLQVNDGPPTALFLVGGGSQIPNLCGKIASRLSIPEERVTLGGKHPYRNISVPNQSLLSPEFVTPLGIGATSRLSHINDLFSITVNGEKVALPGTETIKVLDALLLAGIKASNLIGRTPSPLIYSLNGEKITVRGTPSIPGELHVNGAPATLDTPIRQGDSIVALFAQHGKRPLITLAEVCRPFAEPYTVTVNGREVPMDYLLQIDDSVKVISFASIDNIEADDMPLETLEALPQKTAVASDASLERNVRVSINGKWMDIPVQGSEKPLFVDMLNFVEIDTKAAKGELILTINGNAASYTDPVSDGDAVEIRWES